MQNCKFTPNHFGIFVSLFLPHTHTPHNTAPHSLRFWFHLFACIFYLVTVPAGGNMIWPPPFVSFFFVSFFLFHWFFFHFFMDTSRELLSSFAVHAFMFYTCAFPPSILWIFFCTFCAFVFLCLSHIHSIFLLLFFITNGKNLHARYQRCMCNNKMLA